MGTDRIELILADSRQHRDRDCVLPISYIFAPWKPMNPVRVISYYNDYSPLLISYSLFVTIWPISILRSLMPNKHLIQRCRSILACNELYLLTSLSVLFPDFYFFVPPGIWNQRKHVYNSSFTVRNQSNIYWTSLTIN